MNLGWDGGTEQSRRLTPREFEVLRHIAAGLSDKEVARSLNISPTTVHKQTAAVYRKLGAQNRVTAVIAGLRLGLLHL